jgi:hypothetical protein
LLDAAAGDPDVKTTIKQAALAAENGILKELHQYRYAGVPVQNGWTSPVNGAHFGTDYYSRTAAARANIFVNPRNEAAYFGQEYDSGQQRLSGENVYTITFPANQTPPVNGFWSLTFYDADHFFAPNELNRFSLGTKNKTLQSNPNGSLTIYVRRERQRGRPDLLRADGLEVAVSDGERRHSLFLELSRPEHGPPGRRGAP